MITKLKRPNLKQLKKLDRLIPDGEGAASLRIYCDNSWCVSLNFQDEEFAFMNDHADISSSVDPSSQWADIEDAIFKKAVKLWCEFYPTAK